MTRHRKRVIIKQKHELIDNLGISKDLVEYSFDNKFAFISKFLFWMIMAKLCKTLEKKMIPSCLYISKNIAKKQ